MSEDNGFLERPDGARLAWRRVKGAGPTVVWLGGFRSDMAGTKAEALAGWAQATGRAYVRFDYFAHGASSGDATLGTIGRWSDDAIAVLDQADQQVQHLRLDGDRLGPATQLAPRCVKRVIGKDKLHVLPPCRTVRRPR